MKFAARVLAQPLMAPAIEEAFVPVAIYNNKKGKDAKILARYREPSWNNPVVRFVDRDGKDLIPRKDRVWDLNGIARRSVAALAKVKRPVPPLLEMAVTISAKKTERAAFAMHCFWQGEAALGALAGVASTRAAWIGKHEIVEVVFDPERLAFGKLLAAAKKLDCTRRVWADGEAELAAASKLLGADRVAPLADQKVRAAKPSDDKHALRRSAYAKLELLPIQQTRVNAALAQKRDARPWLTPKQRNALEALRRSNEDRRVKKRPR